LANCFVHHHLSNIGETAYAGDLFNIVMIDDTSVMVSRLDHKYMLMEKQTSIAFDTLCEKYIPAKSKLPTIVAPTIDVSAEFVNRVVMAKVVLAVELATKLYPNPTNVVCLTGPKALIADAAIKKGGVTLVPTTHNVKVIAHDALKASTLACRVGAVTCAMSSCTDPDMTIPAWYCNSTIEKKDVNMKVVMVTVDIGGHVADDGGKQYKSNATVDVPVLVNTRALKVGDELQLLAVAKETQKRKFDVI
jgi:hypothetical protein